MIQLLAKLFGGKTHTAIASGAVWVTLWLIAQVAKQDPTLAATIDPEKVATFLTAAFFTAINLLTNYINNPTVTEVVKGVEDSEPTKVEIPVKKAELLK